MKNKSIFLLVILIGTTFAGAANASGSYTYDALVVVMKNPDVQMQTAVDTLREQLDNLIIVEIGTPDYYWKTAFFHYDTIIVVGHGNENGMLSVNGMQSWRNVAQSILAIAGNKPIHFLSCDSGNVKRYLPEQNRGITFAIEMDAVVGAIVVSFVVAFANSRDKMSLFNHAITEIKERSIALQMHIQEYLPLELGTSETIWHAVWITFLALALLDPFLQTIKTSLTNAILVWAVEYLSYLTTVARLVVSDLGAANWAKVAHDLTNIDFFFFRHDGVSKVSQNIDVIYFAVAIASMGAMDAIDGISAEISILITLLTDTYALSSWALGFTGDGMDLDDTFYLFEEDEGSGSGGSGSIGSGQCGPEIGGVPGVPTFC